MSPKKVSGSVTELKEQWLKEKKVCKRRGTSLVFKDQKKAAKQIIKSFSKKDLVTLCAPPQWGKTGVSLYVSFIMSKKKGISPENVFFITGMSDRSWIQQTKERVLPMWRKNVYHRNTLKKLETRMSKLKEEGTDKDILIIVDECHIANKFSYTMGRLFETSGLRDQEKLKSRNIKILQISATPSNALIDSEEWNHAKVCPKMSSGYVSFQTLLEEDRIRESHRLTTEEGCSDYFEEVCQGEPKYHLVRSLACGRTGPEEYRATKGSIEGQCKKKDCVLLELNMTKSRKEINEIFKGLGKRPPKHTFILIKNMLGASKTISDEFIGSVHESVPSDKNYSSEVQGLPGRMCGWSKRRGPKGPKIYCKKEIIENYVKLYESKFDFYQEDLSWRDTLLKVNSGIKSKASYISIKREEGQEDEEGQEGKEDIQDQKTEETVILSSGPKRTDPEL